MKTLFYALIFTFSLTALMSCGGAENASNETDTDSLAVSEPQGENNLAYKWARLSLTATANDTERFRPRPTITSRMLALVFVSIFDAWTAYDAEAIPVYMHDVEKRPAEEHTLANKEKAISYAAFYALNEYFYSDSVLF